MKNISEWLASNGIAGADFVEADRRWRRSVENSWYRPPMSLDETLAFCGADHPGHLMVTAGRVRGAVVYGGGGERLGRVFDLSIEKATGKVVHVLLGSGGFLGLGRRFHPLPWKLFSYAQDMRGYRLPLTRAQLRLTSRLRRDDLVWCGAGHRSPFDNAYYNAFMDLPAG